MSTSPSKPVPVPMKIEGTPNYVVLPNTTQPKPLQLVQGLDGLMYAFAPGMMGPLSATKLAGENQHIGLSSTSKSSGINQLGAGPSSSSAIPQSLNVATPAGLAAAAASAAVASGGQLNVGALAAGGQMNIGALAAAAALHGQQSPSPFPFIPLYTPFSMSSSLTQSTALSLQPLPLAGGTGAGTFLFPSQTQAVGESGSLRGDKKSSSMHSLLAPGKGLSVASFDIRTEQSHSLSSPSKEYSLSPTISTTKTEPLVHTSSITSLSTSNKDVNLPAIPAMASSYGALDLAAHRAFLLQNQTLRSAHSHESPRTPPSPGTEAKLEHGNQSPSHHSARGLSSLSRYMSHQAPAQKQQETNAAACASPSLEKLLQTSDGYKKVLLASTTTQGASVNASEHHMLISLQDEPHLMQFYNFFHKSQLSRHLRLRILTTEGGANVLKWIEVTRKDSHIEPSFGPVDAARVLISSNGLCKLQLMFPYPKTISTRFIPTTMAQANELFSELSPKHVICPGLPDCENKLNSLGYQPSNIRVVETPSMKRYDHEKCPIWHIPLPCNLYSESGQILHHMCKQCKTLLSTLNKTITKIAGLNINSTFINKAEGGLIAPFNFGAMMSSTAKSSISSQYLLRSPPGRSGEGEGSKTEAHGRRRKKKSLSTDEEGLGSGKPTSTVPGIYQLLQADLTTTVGDNPHTALISSVPMATSASGRTAVSAFELASHRKPATPSKVKVQTKLTVHNEEPATSPFEKNNTDGHGRVSPEPELSGIEQEDPALEERGEREGEEGDGSGTSLSYRVLHLHTGVGSEKAQEYRLGEKRKQQIVDSAAELLSSCSQNVTDSQTDSDDSTEKYHTKKPRIK